MNLSDFKFSKKDFELMGEGLSMILKQKDIPDSFSTVITSILSTTAPDGIDTDKIKRMVEAKLAEKRQQMHDSKEDVVLLQAKLIQLRRFMEQNDMICQVQDIIDAPFKQNPPPNAS